MTRNNEAGLRSKERLFFFNNFDFLLYFLFWVESHCRFTSKELEKYWTIGQGQSQEREVQWVKQNEIALILFLVHQKK